MPGSCDLKEARGEPVDIATTGTLTVGDLELTLRRTTAMKFILIRVRTVRVVHGFDANNREVIEEVVDAPWADKLLALERLLSATQSYLLVSGSYGRVMYWEYEGGLDWLSSCLNVQGLALAVTEIARPKIG